ncbi:acetyl-coenzyme A transporter 1-like [Rhopalosiphum maidis]|uniref:acetyl-coenzyme A transporter 1-like n=1 Tax=Rhopalosiphum maidis TaxID=43146 RepID=UPI000EFF1C2F|nr:acetyl-coenzyme A transporter 1-like [Rhopalosiphum maidis]
MTKRIKNEEKSENPKDSAMDEPNLKGDWLNFYFLILLYTFQGTTSGLSYAFPIILQNTKFVTYNDQAILSFVLWPFSFKLLWAPVVDALHLQWIGRRKSWYIPIQLLIGALFLFFADNIDDWLPESGKPNLNMIVCVLFLINFLAATQDIVVDSWALSLLKKNNVSYSSTCNSTGIAFGLYIGSVCPVLLSSEYFCNKYLRFTPDVGGILSIKSFLLFWGIVFLFVTVLIIFKKERNSELEEDDQIKIDIIQSYKLLWDIFKIKHMKLLLMAILTSMIGLCTSESVTNLKLIDAGVSKDDIMIITTAMFILKMCLPIFVTKYTTGPKPISLYLKLMPARLIWSIFFALLIYYTPNVIQSNEVPMYYYLVMGLVFAVNRILAQIMVTCMVAFFSRISDIRFGGMYMTLLNTVRSIGWVIPNTSFLKMVDTLTFSSCSNDVTNSCSTPDLKNICRINDGKCDTIVDGYYVEVVICLIIGFVWYAVYKRHLKFFESKDRSHWLLDYNRPGNV